MRGAGHCLVILQSRNTSSFLPLETEGGQLLMAAVKLWILDSDDEASGLEAGVPRGKKQNKTNNKKQQKKSRNQPNKKTVCILIFFVTPSQLTTWCSGLKHFVCVFLLLCSFSRFSGWSNRVVTLRRIVLRCFLLRVEGLPAVWMLLLLVKRLFHAIWKLSGQYQCHQITLGNSALITLLHMGM